MRRVSASLLIALLWFGIALPLLQAQPNALPACCRRNGKHHCAMSVKGGGFRAIAPNCPYRGFRALIPPARALKVSSTVLTVSTQARGLVQSAPPMIAWRAMDNTQQRGPPPS